MKKPTVFLSALVISLALAHCPVRSAQNQILGWNNLGMHCMDSDYSVFSILPPYNTIEAQLIVNGQLVTASNGYSVTYEAVTDLDGSVNATSIGKGNFSQFDQLLYGADLPAEVGLMGWAMPGISNVPQSMRFESSNQAAPGVFTPANWFHAEGIPITPFDDEGVKNPYPLMRLIARNSSNQPIATNDIVLPVSDEMDCRMCHASGVGPAAQPAAGWVWSVDPERDYRLNILLLHDERRDPATYPELLESTGFNSQGLFRSVVADGHPVLCAKCHLSEALPGTGVEGVPPLTEAVHALHAGVLDPILNITLDNSANRTACYRCHPGSTTKCLRGAMGGAIADDGSMAMQCQSCHGNMSAVGSTDRVGWLMEPNCQSCHTGTATDNNGEIRYTSSFENDGSMRVPSNQTFATQPNTPAAGLSLYRFSAGHGGLQCSACHGSTHAEFPATHRNDNLRNESIQGHAGVMVECTACHTTTPNTVSGGPHGMHPVGQTWISRHPDIVEDSGAAQCAACHGADYRGSVLSRMQANRTLDAYGTKNWWRGFQVGCYNCHRGPSDDDQSNNTPAVVLNVSTNTTNDQTIGIPLQATDTNGNALTLRIVSQPEHGSVGLNGNLATYFPEPGFVGTETFTFAAWDGSTDSNLGTGTVAVAQGPFSISTEARVPDEWPAGWAAPFGVSARPENINAPVLYDWDFGDGSPHMTNGHGAHVYAEPGTFDWQVVATVQTAGSSAVSTNSGAIIIAEPQELTFHSTGGTLEIAWPAGVVGALLEESASIGGGAEWSVSTNAVTRASGNTTVVIDGSEPAKFFRLRAP